MDVSQGLEVFLYGVVALFAVGDLFRQMQETIMIGQKAASVSQ